MKLQLQIATASGYSATFQHAGPVVRIGRDADGELSLQGEAGHAVSGRHARIDLTPSGALLADAGSRNGTLLNDKLIQEPVPLRAGDRITLGHTGPTLTVVELDLTLPPKVPNAPPRDPFAASKIKPASGPVSDKILIVGGVVALILVVSVVVWLGTKGTRNKKDPEEPTVAKNDFHETSANNRVPKQKKENPEPPKENPPDPPPVKQPKETTPDPLAGKVREVGRFVMVPRWGPSVLLQRQGDGYPWLPLLSGDKVSTASTLISLPGYRSTIALEGGLLVTLWGNLPDFSSVPPVQESVVMLNTPAAGFDIDLTLERGRIHLANQKPTGPAKIQFRFLRQTWELTLPDAGSEACLELWSAPATAVEEINPVWVCLFTRSRAQLKVGEKVEELAPSSRVSWVNSPGAVPRREVLAELPDWWVKPPDHSKQQVQDAMLALLDWRDQLGLSNEVIDSILTQIRGTTDSTQRVIGVQFIAALDQTPFLVDYLENQHPEVRGAARHSLQAFLFRRPQYKTELIRILRERRGFPQDKAALVCRLLQRLPETDLSLPKTYQDLIDQLDHQELVIRELAFWHLALLVPEGAKTIDYNPNQNANKRQEAVGKWRKLVPKDNLPRRNF